MSQLSELLELPERVQKSQFVVTLQQGVRDPASVVNHYAVTKQIHDAYDQALGFVKVAISEHQNVASYLHGSFGSGKSHFMALLSLMLANDATVWATPELHDLRATHAWLKEKTILRLHFNMINADSIEHRIFQGYLEHLAEHHPEATLPPVFKDAGLFENARELRATLGDEAFFTKMNAGHAASPGWGKLKTAQPWDAARFDAALDSTNVEERAKLLTALTRSHFSAFATGNQGFVEFEEGLGVICAHAKKELGADCLVLFLDELILWLGSIAADKPRLNREVPKLSRLVERDIGGDEVPVVSFAARQRDIAEMVGDEFIGPEHEHLRTALAHWHGRFNEIKLGDKNLPEIVEKRVVRAKNDAARQTLDAAFDKLRAGLRGNAYGTLLGSDGDERDFRKVYPFSPALIETLIALSHLLQRERTALKVLMELLVEHMPEHMPEFSLGDVVPVGELWDVLSAGEEPMDGAMRQLFRQAKRVYEIELAPVLKAHASDSPRTDQRLVKTLILAALVPGVPALKNLTVSRLVQLNHGSLKTLIPGGEVQKASTLLRAWAASTHHLRVEEGEDPRVMVVLDDVDLGPIVDSAQSYNTEGARKAKLRQILFDALGLEDEHDSFEHKVVWRGSRRVGSVIYGNVREMDDVMLKAPADHDFRLVIDYPFDKHGYGPDQDEARLQQFLESGLSSPTIAWLPSFFGDKLVKALGELVIIDRILDGDTFKLHMDHLRDDAQRRAKSALEHLGNQKRAQVRKALAVAYGLRSGADASEGEIDEARSIDRHFFTLYPDCTLHAPAKSEFSRAVQAAVGELLDQRYPRHPYFEPGDRTVTTGQLDKAFESYGRVCGTPEQRLPVSKRELGEYTLPERLGMLDLTEANASARARFQQDIDKRLLADGIQTPSVRQVKNILDPEGVRGLAEDVADFEVRCYALVSHRELLRDGRPVTDVKFGKVGPDWELVKAPLPGMTEWSDAVDRAGALFGVSVSRALNVNNLRSFSEKLIEAVQKARHRRAHELADVLALRAQALGAEGLRLKTAVSVAELLRGLDHKDPVVLVERLAKASTLTSLTAMKAHLDSSAANLAELGSEMLFNTLTALRERGGDDATQILGEACAALESDELNLPLAPALHRLGLAAQNVLYPKADPKRATSLVAQGSVHDVRPREAARALSEIHESVTAALEQGGAEARLELSWKVTKS